MYKVLITARSVAHCQECIDLLRQNGCEVIDGSGDAPRNEREMVALIKGMDAVIAGVDEISASVIAAGKPTLKVISRNGVGYNKVDIQAAHANDVTVTLSVGTNNISVCELVFGLLLAVSRSIVRQNEAVRAGGWQRVQGIELFGKTLGVVGTGHIGAEVIKRASAFGMKILTFDLYPRVELTELYGAQYVSLDELYRDADFITLHVPATQDTTGMINKKVLETMKDSAILINTARGDLVDEEALAVALKTGKIAGYGADTMLEEPPPQDHPFLQLPNVVITPHCGGYTREAVVRCSVTAGEEVLRVLQGHAPLFPVK
ncbi:MAG TPA: phosphoglycerate dehydrogenase [Selenomonadales bacterium]|nr:phosphoglycerate dehydrogenase [Selenomonadales bacterium]